MKAKILSPLLGIMFALFLVAPTAQAETPPVLLDAIDNTFNGGFHIESEGEMKYGESNVTFQSNAYLKDRMYQEDGSFDMNINFSDFEEEMEGMVDASSTMTYIFDMNEQHHFFRVDALNVSLDLPEELMEEFANGLMEMMKHMVGKTYEIDIQDILERIQMADLGENSFTAEDIDELEMTLLSLSSQDELLEDIDKLLVLILDSGLFQIEARGTSFIITFADQPTLNDPRGFFQTLFNSVPLPEGMQQEVLAELEAMTDADVEEFQNDLKEALNMIKAYMDFTWEIGIRNARIDSMDVDMSILFSQIPLSPITNDLSLTANERFHYNVPTISAPAVVDHDMISLTKLIKGMIAMAEHSYKEYQSYAAEYDYEDYPAATYEDSYLNDYEYDYDYSDEEESDIDTRRAEIRNDPASTWYDEYVYHIGAVLPLDFELNPAEEVKMYQMYEALKHLILYTDVLEDRSIYEIPGYRSCYFTTDEEFIKNLSFVSMHMEKNRSRCIATRRDQAVTRSEGLTMIIQTVFRDEANPVEFAVNNGFVSGEYASGDNGVKNMNMAEMVKIFSKAIDYRWEKLL